MPAEPQQNPPADSARIQMPADATPGKANTAKIGAVPPTARMLLALPENRIQPRFKIFFSFGPQLAALDGQCALDRFHPVEQ